MRKLDLLLPAVIALAACDKTPANVTGPRAGDPNLALVINRRFDVVGTALSDCGGEDIAVTGTFHRILTITSDRAGGFHVNDHMDYTGLQGTSAITGAKYVANQISVVNFNVPGPQLGFEVTRETSFKLIGQGTAPDEVLTMLIHYTINANGELTTFVDNFRVRCD
ncbi:MAG: hypothetical protein ABR585_12255 [Gemmatimonadaceae bacterium]